MRILFFGAHFPRPNNPTIGTWALSQVSALRGLGHEIRVVSPVPAVPVLATKILGRGTSALCPARHTWGDIEARYIPWTVYPVGPLSKTFHRRPGLFVRPAWMLASRKFLAIAAEYAPDVIYAHHGQLAGFVAARVARKLGIPFFITEHDFDEIDVCAGNKPRRDFYRGVTRDISAWIAVADRMRASMNRIFPGVPAVTIHNGAEPVPREMAAVPRPPALAGRIVVLCVAFMYKRKNVPLLIGAFDSIANRYPDAVLAVGGDGDDMPAVRAAIENARHGSQILLLGALKHREVMQYMAWCDVFALIGGDEPFATVFSEAMSAGKAIVFASDGGITDVAKDGVHGLSVEPGDAPSAVAALDRLLGDPELRGRLGRGASGLAAQLTWAANARNIAELFQAALEGPVPAPA
jgi:glycosyltransferase involved in cell wall biosynthesis